jgi:hypothetical protein
VQQFSGTPRAFPHKTGIIAKIFHFKDYLKLFWK